MDLVTVYGITLRVPDDAHRFPELREHCEANAREAIQHKYQHPAHALTWYHDLGMEWTDPKTGETYPAVPVWVLLAETGDIHG